MHAMDFNASDDAPTPALRRRTNRRHHERRGDASFAGARGVEEALGHLFHPGGDGVDASPQIVADGGGHDDGATAPLPPGRY